MRKGVFWILYQRPAFQVTKKVVIQKEENAETCLQHQYSPDYYFLLYFKHMHLPYKIQLSYQAMCTYKEQKELTDCLF